MEQFSSNQSNRQMNDLNDIVVGLDIGTTKIAAIVGQRDARGKIKILGMGRSTSNGVMRGEVVNIDQTVAAIKEAVAEAEQKANYKIKEVYVGIAGQHISSKQNRGIYTLENPDEEISHHDIRAMIDSMNKLALEPGERIIHVLPQEFSVDNLDNIKDPIGMCGNRIEANFHIITGKVAAARNIKKSVEKAGLVMSGLILEPLASSAAVLTEQDMEAGVVLVDIGGGTTDIAIFQDNVIRHTAVIPFAGNIITEDIRKGCRVLREHAEKMKVKYGSALAEQMTSNDIISIPDISNGGKKEISCKVLAEIIQARMEEIISQIYFEIRNSGFANRLYGGVVVTGGGSQLKHIKQLMEYHTGIGTRIGYPNQHVANQREEIKSPIYATGIGLILKAFEELDDERRDSGDLIEAASVNNYKTASTPEIIKEESVQQTQTNATEKLLQADRDDKWWRKLAKATLNWFEDERANKDFE